MTEQSSPNTDVERVVRHCTDNLRPSAEWVPFIGYPDGLALAVIDAIWAMIARYPITRGVIRRYSQHRTMEGADPSRDGLSDLLDFYERIGGVDEFIDLIGTRNRVSTQPDAVRKGEAVHQAATVLSELGIETTAQFVAADGTAVGEQARASWLSVPGQGSGISWRYLRMLVGLPDVKPDRMVVRFIASALEVNEQSLDQDEVVRLVQVAAEHFGVDQRSLDHEIWEHQSGSRQGHDPATEQEQLHALASSFVGMAFTALAEDYVIPTSRFHPFIRVGRDYEGGPVMGAPEFVEFQSALEGAFPGRFADPMTRSHPEFPNTYMFGLLEAATARCAQEGGLFEAETPPVERSIHELFEVLRAADYEMSACRAVSHLTTTSDEPVRIGAITVFPEAQSEEGLLERTLRLIPGAPGSFNQEPPRFYDPPHALLVSSARASDADHSETQRALSNAMDRFLLLARLLHAGTHQSCWEVVGPSTLVAGSHPKYRTFGKTTMPDVRFQRVVRLSREDAPAFVALGDFLDAATVRREGMAATSFDVARYRFNRSHEAGDDYERVVDLATALEAILTGSDSDTDAISLRLRTRAAAILSTDGDSGRAIFGDVGALYGLRSKLVHGGNIKERELRKTIEGISTVPEHSPFGVALAFALDRLRDLVRRSFLARLCLASGTDPRWPFDGSASVDAALGDEAERELWKRSWRDQLATLGAAEASEAAAGGIDPLAPQGP